MTAGAAPVELRDSAHHLPAGAKALRATKPGKWIRLTLAIRPKDALPDLSGLDTVRPGARAYLNRAQLASHYGSDPDALTRISAFAKAYNLTVTRDERASARLGLGGTAADLCAAFNVKLFDYTHPELGMFHARTGPISIPAALAGDILGVFGFNNHRVLRRKSGTAALAADPSTPGRAWFLPGELAQIYNFPSANAQAQCIGLLEFGGGVETADVAAYFGKVGVPAPGINVIAIDGVATDPTADPDSTAEVMLDIDIAGALGAGAKLAVYFSTFDEKGLVDGLSAVLNDAVNDPSVISISWGCAENAIYNNSGVPWSNAAITACDQSFLALAHLGITVCVASGDDGAAALATDGRAHVNYPAASPYVLAVGGTTLHAATTAAGSLQTTEIVWNDGPGACTGGGVSEVELVPAWQQGIVPPSVNPGHFAGRAVPDVAANADPATGYYVRAGGTFSVTGGTSAAAPLWAALIARCNALNGKRAGNFNALLYSHVGPSKLLQDIVAGNNDAYNQLDGQYAAGPGWDACTGWGTPDGTALQKAL